MRVAFASPPALPGLFLVFEGLDGSGKSTQCRLLGEALEQRGHTVVQTREPTHGPWGQKIRAMAQSGQRVSPEEELAWFLHDRQEHIQNLILPSLAQGHVVIQDRYYPSTAAYQGSRGLDVDEILQQHQSFAPLPHRVFLLEIPPDEGLRRIQHSRGDTPDAFETLASLERCAAIFHCLEMPGLLRLNGLDTPTSLHHTILNEALRLLDER